MEGEVVLLDAGLPGADVDVAHLARRRRAAEAAVEDVLTRARSLTLHLVHYKHTKLLQTALTKSLINRLFLSNKVNLKSKNCTSRSSCCPYDYVALAQCVLFHKSLSAAYVNSLPLLHHPSILSLVFYLCHIFILHLLIPIALILLHFKHLVTP